MSRKRDTHLWPTPLLSFQALCCGVERRSTNFDLLDRRTRFCTVNVRISTVGYDVKNSVRVPIDQCPVTSALDNADGNFILLSIDYFRLWL